MARRARWRAVRRVLTAAGLRRRLSRRPSGSALGRQRARQNLTLAALLLLGNLVLWLVTDQWWVRGCALALCLFAWPVLLVLAFDRRAGR